MLKDVHLTKQRKSINLVPIKLIKWNHNVLRDYYNVCKSYRKLCYSS